MSCLGFLVGVKAAEAEPIKWCAVGPLHGSNVQDRSCNTCGYDDYKCTHVFQPTKLMANYIDSFIPRPRQFPFSFVPTTAEQVSHTLAPVQPRPTQIFPKSQPCLDFTKGSTKNRRPDESTR